jgi:hypothetical protein
MGLFDDIYCEYPLPSFIVEGRKVMLRNNTWQTKSLENLLNHYLITADGRLVLDDEDMEYHGFIKCYDIYQVKKNRYWIEYTIKFTNGYVVEARVKVDPI